MEHATSVDSLLPSAQPVDSRLRLDLAARPVEVGRARHAVVDLLVREGVTSTIVDDLELVVSELVSNAVVHSATGSVHLEVGVGDEVVLAVANDGDSSTIPAVDSWQLPGAHAASGRGLAIVRRLTDSVEVRQSGRTTIVVCRRQLPDRGPTA